jgi:hypothetical protein
VQTIDFLPLVKAYPALSKTYGEVSCIAGVRMDGDAAPEWIRLYPVPFRALEHEQQFAKYQPIRLQVSAHRGDRRPETRRPNRDSIVRIGDALPTRGAWRARKPFVEPIMAPSMCEVQRMQKSHGTSLAVFRPREVLDLVIEPRDVNAEKTEIARAWAAQPSLLDHVGLDERGQQLRALEQIPWTFKYRYHCHDPACQRPHVQTIVDWEIAEFYRRVASGPDWQDQMRERWLGQLCGPTRDTAFYIGNQHQHPNAFLVLGVWWPERRDQLALEL